MGNRELVALLNLSSWCLVMVERLFLAVPWGCLRFVIVVFPDHTHLPFFIIASTVQISKLYIGLALVLLLWNICVFMSCVCHALASVHFCLVVTCWERADLLALVCDV